MSDKLRFEIRKLDLSNLKVAKDREIWVVEAFRTVARTDSEMDAMLIKDSLNDAETRSPMEGNALQETLDGLGKLGREPQITVAKTASFGPAALSRTQRVIATYKFHRSRGAPHHFAANMAQKNGEALGLEIHTVRSIISRQSRGKYPHGKRRSRMRTHDVTTLARAKRRKQRSDKGKARGKRK